MSDLTFHEKRILEKLFQMHSGYVLNFVDRTFRDFFWDNVKCDINDKKYYAKGTSKANRFRCFWDIENNYLVGKSIEKMIMYGQQENCFENLSDLISDCQKISTRLLCGSIVTELDALTTSTSEIDFEALSEHLREAIEKNQPESALDRLHTFVIKYIRKLCESLGIFVDKEKALHSLFGEYVKKLQEINCIDSEMTILILKSSISILQKFNDVRNNQSLAHDNPILNYDESVLIFNNIANLIRFIKSLEIKIENRKPLLL